MHLFKDFGNKNDKLSSLRNDDSLEESEAIRKREEEIREEYRLSLRELELNRQKNQDSYVEALQNIFTSSKIAKPISKSQLLQHHTQPLSESAEQLMLINMPSNSRKHSVPQSTHHSVDHFPSSVQQWRAGHLLNEIEASVKQNACIQQDATNYQTKRSSLIHERQDQCVFQASQLLSPVQLSSQQPQMNSVSQQSQQPVFQMPVQSLSLMQSSYRPQLQTPTRYSAPAFNELPIKSSSQKAYQPQLQEQHTRCSSPTHTGQLSEPILQQSYQSQSNQPYMRLPRVFLESPAPSSSQSVEQQLQLPYPHPMQPTCCQSLQLPLQSLSPVKSTISSAPPQCGDSHVLQSQNYDSKHSVKHQNNLPPSTCNPTLTPHCNMLDSKKLVTNSVRNNDMHFQKQTCNEIEHEASVGRRSGGTSNNLYFNYLDEAPIKVKPTDQRSHSNHRHGDDQITMHNFSYCQETEGPNYFCHDVAQQSQLQNLSMSFLNSDQQATQPTKLPSRQPQKPVAQNVSPTQLPIDKLDTMQQQQLSANMADKSLRFNQESESKATKQTYYKTNSDASHSALQAAQIAVSSTDTLKAANHENSIDLHPHQMKPIGQVKLSPTLPESLPFHEPYKNYSMAKQQALRRQYDSSQAEKALRQVYEREMEAELRVAQGKVPQEQVSTISQPSMNVRFVGIVALR